MPVTSVVLRPWQSADAGTLCSITASTPDLATQTGHTVLDTIDAAMDFIGSNLEWTPGVSCHFAIELDGTIAGSVGLTRIDNRHRTAWLSYWVSGQARGRGLATRGAASVADWAIRELNIFRLELGHRTNNPASCAAATRAGFIPEGIERSKLQYGDRRYDVETHARLASDPRPDVDLIAIRTPAG